MSSSFPFAALNASAALESSLQLGREALLFSVNLRLWPQYNWARVGASDHERKREFRSPLEENVEEGHDERERGGRYVDGECERERKS